MLSLIWIEYIKELNINWDIVQPHLIEHKCFTCSDVRTFDRTKLPGVFTQYGWSFDGVTVLCDRCTNIQSYNRAMGIVQK